MPQTERYFTNLETAASAVRVLCSDEAGQSYLLKALGKRPQARWLGDCYFPRTRCCQCSDGEPVRWGSAGLLGLVRICEPPGPLLAAARCQEPARAWLCVGRG